jgi:hypothetical protein
MKLAITICATKSYTYAMSAQARRVLANIAAARAEPGALILVGDTSRELKAVAKYYEAILPEGWVVRLAGDATLTEGGENYKPQAQLLIAAMRSEAFAQARKFNADFCWSLDSDVLPPANALRCSLTMLEFDGGYYSVSTCPYPNGAFLGGCGTRQHPIAEDFLPGERKLPPELKAEFDANEAELKKLNEDKAQPTDEQRKKWEETNKKIKECPPDGNIWEVIAKHGWRRRGWLDHYAPGIGRGAVLPSDWCGFGCTLLNREALALATFDGYDGGGTEDLFVCWHRWHPAGLRINVITHCPCDHVIWEKKKGGDEKKYVHHVAYHEQEGEYRGHLRTRQIPWLEVFTIKL